MSRFDSLIISISCNIKSNDSSDGQLFNVNETQKITKIKPIIYLINSYKNNIEQKMYEKIEINKNNNLNNTIILLNTSNNSNKLLYYFTKVMNENYMTNKWYNCYYIYQRIKKVIDKHTTNSKVWHTKNLSLHK